MTCPDCGSEPTHTGGGGEAIWTRFACNNVAESVHGTVTYTDDCERRIRPGSPHEGDDTMSTDTDPKTTDTNGHTQVVKLDFSAFIAKMREEWGPLSSPPRTVEEYVANEAVANLSTIARTAVERKVDSLVGDLQATIEATVNEVIHTRVAERFAQPFQPMKYGEPVGDPVSILDLIDRQVEKSCTFTSSNSYNRDLSTIERVVREAIDIQLGTELRSEVGKAKEQVLTQVRNKAADIMAESIATLAKP